MKKTRSESIRRWSRGWASVVCERCHKSLWRIPKRYTGPEGRFFFSARNAALKGPLFHGIIGGIARGECIAGIDGWKSGRLAYALAWRSAVAHGLTWKSGASAPRRRPEKWNRVPEGRQKRRAIRNRTHRQHRYPPLQRTQVPGTRTCVNLLMASPFWGTAGMIARLYSVSPTRHIFVCGKSLSPSCRDYGDQEVVVF